MNDVKTIVIVDSDEMSCRALHHFLVTEGFYACYFTKIEDVKPELRLLDPSLLLLDIEGEKGRGLEFLAYLRKEHPSLSVIIVSACKRRDVIVASMKLGAEDYIHKPYEQNELIFSITRVVGWGPPPSFPGKSESVLPVTRMIVGPSEMMLNMKAVLERAADTDINVLITGESGTGKELVARMLYAESPRRNKDFIRVNCAALPYRMLESELFGHEKGAFTGAKQAKPGKFELAHRGTLYLDEIAELHPTLQAKLLQVLQDGKFSRLGGKQDIQVDVRVIASTNRNLEEEVLRRRFRDDLFFRLNVLTIKVPPLRDRKEEIPFLARIYLDKFAGDFGKKPRSLYKKTVKAFQKYDWPGNIRELENAVKRIVLFGKEEMVRQEIARKKSPAGPAPDQPASSIHADGIYSIKKIRKEASMKAEKEAILDALKRSQWNRRKAAEALAISYKALLYKMKQMDLNR